MRCQATTEAINGQFFPCPQEAHDETLCYYHAKVADGLIQPAAPAKKSNRPEDVRTAAARVMVGARVIWEGRR